MKTRLLTPAIAVNNGGQARRILLRRCGGSDNDDARGATSRRVCSDERARGVVRVCVCGGCVCVAAAAGLAARASERDTDKKRNSQMLGTTKKKNSQSHGRVVAVVAVEETGPRDNRRDRDGKRRRRAVVSWLNAAALGAAAADSGRSAP